MQPQPLPVPFYLIGFFVALVVLLVAATFAFAVYKAITGRGFARPNQGRLQQLHLNNQQLHLQNQQILLQNEQAHHQNQQVQIGPNFVPGDPDNLPFSPLAEVAAIGGMALASELISDPSAGMVQGQQDSFGSVDPGPSFDSSSSAGGFSDSSGGS